MELNVVIYLLSDCCLARNINLLINSLIQQLCTEPACGMVPSAGNELMGHTGAGPGSELQSNGEADH